MLIRDGGGGGGGERVTARPRIPPKKTGETVDRRQNNGSVKAVSLRHCPATCAPVLGQSHKDNVRCTAVEEQPEAKALKSTFAAQLHLPAHDLFWAEGPAPPPCS